MRFRSSCRPVSFPCSGQISGGLDFYAAGISGIILQGDVLGVDDLDRLTYGARGHGQLYGFRAGLLQRLLARRFVIVDQLLIGPADLGNSGADPIFFISSRISCVRKKPLVFSSSTYIPCL